MEATLRAKLYPKVDPSGAEVVSTSRCVLQRLPTITGTSAAAAADFSDPSSSDDCSNDAGLPDFSSDEADI